MRRGERETPPDGLGSALAVRVEGYLLAHTHHEQAHREAESLCARLPWLTTAQAEDVTRQYVRQRIELTRRMLQMTLERADQLRGEYEARYAVLRRDLLRRHTAFACAVVVCSAALSTAVCLLGR
ncbi:hypothetical protein GCM10009601_25030 [Streptomyces thermospinosisporus]|uniref:Cytochrome C oxidase subunit I n=1 Tax=Streptomyces thermospinosisporus TaxID=161482 RepID=A0ABN1YUB7_9ACTN